MSRRSRAGLILALLGLMQVAGGTAARPPQTRVGAGLDARRYRLTLDLGADPSAFRAVAAIDLDVTSAGVRRASLDLVGLQVDSVRADGAPAAFERGAGVLSVDLGRRYGPGQHVTVEVFYHGAPANGLNFRRNVHGHPTVFADNWPNRARYWFPSIDRPADKAAVEFRVRAPAGWTVVANGRRLSDVAAAGDGTGREVVWRTDEPIPVYTMVVGAGVLSVRDVGALGCRPAADRCVRVSEWVFPEDTANADRVFARAPRMLAIFDSVIGPFPYEKLALVQSSTQFGGMENSSAIFFGEKPLADGTAREVTVAHEIAHQWFGDAVTERDWPELWLSEGFATYFATVFYEIADGDTAARRLLDDAEARYLGSPDDVARPVIDPSIRNLFDLLNRNNYEKGAWVLRMLRARIGDRAFFDGIRAYYATYRDSTAVTADFRRVMEKTSGQDLRAFFDQWLRRPGYPKVTVAVHWDATAGALQLEVRQVQQWADFTFPLEMEAEVDGRPLRHTFDVSTRDQRFSWPLPAAPGRLRADPRNRVLGLVELLQ